MTWTRERTEILKKLWAEGLSASQIANRLGGVTRNAVIGRVHRIGLPGRAKSTRPKSRKRKRHHSPPSQPMPVPSGQSTAGAPSKKSYTTWRRNEAVTLIELKPHHCRWPVGEMTGERQKFCGQQSEAGAPYCGHHDSIAYESASTRQKRSRKRRAAAVDRQAKARQHPSSGISRYMIDSEMEDWI